MLPTFRVRFYTVGNPLSYETTYVAAANEDYAKRKVKLMLKEQGREFSSWKSVDLWSGVC